MYKLALADLSAMSSTQKAAAIQELIAHTQTANGSMSVQIRNRIRHFEIRYEMASAELLERLRQNPDLETADIARWLFQIGRLKTHDENQARA